MIALDYDVERGGFTVPLVSTRIVTLLVRFSGSTASASRFQVRRNISSFPARS